MKRSEVLIGRTYMAKVTGKVVPVRLDASNPHGGWDGTNMATGRPVRIKSAKRLRGRARGIGRTEPKDGPRKPRAAKGPTLPQETPVRPDGPKAGLPIEDAPAGKAGGNGGLSCLAAAARVLAEAGKPMRCQEIIDAMLQRKLWDTGGKTPAATLHAAMCREIKARGGDSRFGRTGVRGEFTASVKA